jgi:hypothetical protein
MYPQISLKHNFGSGFKKLETDTCTIRPDWLLLLFTYGKQQVAAERERRRRKRKREKERERERERRRREGEEREREEGASVRMCAVGSAMLRSVARYEYLQHHCG